MTELFTPKAVNKCVMPNRLVVPAMVTNYCTADGMITERYIRYIEEKAKGGWGMIITEDYAVEPHGKGYEKIPGLWNDEQIAGNKELTARIHQYESKLICQMYHPGRQSSKAVNGGVTPWAPSATKDPICMTESKEMTVDEIHELVKDFGEAAARCKEAGFDGIEIHCAHGYLLSEFLSPFVNKRTDEYGGCFDNRVRIMDEVYAAVRQAVGPDFAIQVRISGNEWVQGGRTEAETYELARHCEEIGFDCIHVTNGIYASAPMHQAIGPMFVNHAPNMDTAEQIKQLVSIPVIVTNRINDPRMADTLIKMGKADFVGMGRGSIADPHLPNKAKAGKCSEINYCVACLQGCEQPLFDGKCVTCLVNPRVGREYESDLKPAESKKKVMVIGSGPAGLMAARTAAMRGHQVTVYEAQEDIGGQFRAAAYPIGKGELSTLCASLRQELEDLNVPILLNTEVTEELIAEKKPDAIVIATGAKPLMPKIKGMDGVNVMTAEDALLGKQIVETPAVVCGGGEVGCETAHYLAQTNPDVTILEMKDSILNDMMIMNKVCLMKLMGETQGLKTVTGATVSEITDHSVSYTDKSGNTVTIPARSVISAFGYRAYDPLQQIAEKHCSEVYTVGCAVKAGNALTATREGYEAGLKI